MRVSLFRAEALEARQAQWLGGIQIAKHPSFTVVACAALCMAAALLAFTAWGEMARKVTAHGVLLPVGGLINVTAPQAGVVAAVLVREGDVVSAGQAMFTLKSERVTTGGDADALNALAIHTRRISLESERRLAEHALLQRQDATLQRVQSLAAEERQALSEQEAHTQRVQLAHKSLERQQELASNGFVTMAQVQQKQEELLDMQLRARSAERNLSALQRELKAALAERKSNETLARTTLVQLDRAVATLNQEAAENDSRSVRTVVATQAGKVSALTVNPGKAVQAGQSLASLVPGVDGAKDNPSELQAQLFAPSRITGFVKSGQLVWMRYSAFPYQKFGMAEGQVISISRSPISTQDVPAEIGPTFLAAIQAAEPLYRITVRLPRQYVNSQGSTLPLTAGMSLDADIRQEKRKLWEWLLEPVLATFGNKRNLSDETKSDPGG